MLPSQNSIRSIKLAEFNVGFRHPLNGVCFPHVFRVTRYQSDGSPAAPYYTLCNRGAYSGEMACYVRCPQFTVIQALDPQIDTGWVIVRHHSCEKLAAAYLDGCYDNPTPYKDWAMFFKTPNGIFTVVHRPATPRTPDHLLFYVTKAPSREACAIYETHVVLPDGTAADAGLVSRLLWK
jgi:hypothetical protein